MQTCLTLRELYLTFVYSLIFLGTPQIAASSNPCLAGRQLESSPLPPKQDPWYTAPPNFAAYRPGQILRVRSAPGNLASITPNCSAAYNLLYRSTDSLFQPAWAVTTIFVPQQVHETQGVSDSNSTLVSYQYAYDSADLNSSPSYSLYTSSVDDISLLLSKGWFVNVPDYEGPFAAYTAGLNSGFATLDSTRAVLSASLGLSSRSRYAMWGYSGGALASEWAAELQALYAPELNFSGAALGGLTPNITSVLTTVNKQANAGLIPPGLLGLFSQYPALEDFLLSKLKVGGPFNQTGFLAARNMNITETDTAFYMQDIAEYFWEGFSFLRDPAIRHVLYNNGQMGFHGLPQMPLYIYKAIADEISPIGDTDGLVERFCRAGVMILYRKNTIGGHVAESLNGREAAVRWLVDMLTTGMSSTTCETQVVAINTTDSPLRIR